MSAEFVEFYSLEPYNNGSVFINRNDITAVKEYDTGIRPVYESSIYLASGYVFHVKENVDEVLEKISLRYGARK